MTDLARMLGDVYGEDPVSAPASMPPVPVWVDGDPPDERLVHWVPERPGENPTAERSMLADLAGRRSPGGDVPPPQPVDEEVVADDVGPAFVVVAHWMPGDDDILPVRGRKRRRRR